MTEALAPVGPGRQRLLPHVVDREGLPGAGDQPVVDGVGLAGSAQQVDVEIGPLVLPTHGGGAAHPHDAYVGIGRTLLREPGHPVVVAGEICLHPDTLEVTVPRKERIWAGLGLASASD